MAIQNDCVICVRIFIQSYQNCLIERRKKNKKMKQNMLIIFSKNHLNWPVKNAMHNLWLQVWCPSAHADVTVKLQPKTNRPSEEKKNEIKRENGHLELIASQASHKSNEYTSVELFLAVHCMDMVNNFVFQFSIKLCIILKSKGYWLFVSHLILSMEREVHWSRSLPAPNFFLLLALSLSWSDTVFSENLFSFC